MLFYFGDRKLLIGKEWMMFELSEQTQKILVRVGKAVPTMFRGQSVEIFIPIAQRDVDTFILSTINIIFIHSDASLTTVMRLKTNTGVEGVLYSGDRLNKG